MTKAQSLIDTVYVAIYLRLSRDDQNGSSESMSISNQRDMLMDYCEERAWKVFDIYIDDGFSGTTFERPGFQRMIEDIKSGSINVVLTKDLSRLGRNYVMTGQYTDFFFPEHGVRYVAINDSYDSDKEDNDIAPFKNILNEMYAKDISKKMRISRALSAKQGKFMGSKPPFGYTKSPEDKHLLIPDPPAATIAQRIFREFAGGESGRNIAAKLNAEGIDTPAVYYFKQTGKRATRGDSCQQLGSSTIIQLLKNQVYIGDMVQCKRKVASFKTKKRLVTNTDDWIIVEGTHEPLIDHFTWNCTQKRLEEIKHSRSNNAVRINSKNEVNIFSGIIRCADCGATMAYNHFERKGGSEKNIYRCSRYVNNGKDTCSTHHIDAELLEFVILKDIQRHAETAIKDESQLLARLVSFSSQERKKETAMWEQSLRETTNRLAFISDASKKLFEEKVADNVPMSLFKKMFADYEHEVVELEKKAADIRQCLQGNENGEANIQNWLKCIKECIAIEKLDRATVYHLIDNVAVHEQCDECGIRTQTIQVKYKFVGCLN